MDKLIISGCSWSCGEWGLENNDQKLFLKEDCFTNILKNSFKVFNISRGGGSNWESLFSVSNFHYFPNNKYHIILFQTDPSRMALSEKFDISKKDIENNLKNTNELKIFFQSMLELFYYKIDLVAKKINTPINIVGGLSDVDINICKNFDNINIFCQSWKSLLDKNFVPQSMPIQIDSNLFEMAMKLKKFDLCDEIQDYNLKNFHLYNDFLSSKYIGPVFGDFHPNRDAFKIMSDFIVGNKNKLV